MDPISALIMGGLTLLGVVGTNKNNQQIATDNRDFQQSMQNTAHQREMADFSAAGINPIMTSGTGGSGVATQGMPEQKDPLSAAVSSAMGGMQLQQAHDSLKQNQQRVDNETRRTDADVAKTISDTSLNPNVKDKLIADTLLATTSNSAKAAEIRLTKENIAGKRLENKSDVINFIGKKRIAEDANTGYKSIKDLWNMMTIDNAKDALRYFKMKGDEGNGVGGPRN